LNSIGGWCGSEPSGGENWVQFDFRVTTILRGFRTQSVIRPAVVTALVSSIRLLVSGIFRLDVTRV